MTVENREPVCGQAKVYAKECFRFLASDELDTLCPFLSLRLLPADETLMREGEEGGFMAFLLQGKLAVRKEAAFAGKHILLAILEPGTIVGEISVVANGMRNATVVALEECAMLELNRANFDAFLADNPALGVKFLRHIVQVVSLRLRKADDRLVRLL